jgi:hypothetical protein
MIYKVGSFTTAQWRKAVNRNTNDEKASHDVNGNAASG